MLALWKGMDRRPFSVPDRRGSSHTVAPCATPNHRCRASAESVVSSALADPTTTFTPVMAVLGRSQVLRTPAGHRVIGIACLAGPARFPIDDSFHSLSWRFGGDVHTVRNAGSSSLAREMRCESTASLSKLLIGALHVEFAIAQRDLSRNLLFWQPDSILPP